MYMCRTVYMYAFKMSINNTGAMHMYINASRVLALVKSKPITVEDFLSYRSIYLFNIQ